MTERGVTASALVTIAPGASAGNKVKQQGQFAARTSTAKAHQQTVFRLGTTLGIASLALCVSVALATSAEQGGHDHSVSDF